VGNTNFRWWKYCWALVVFCLHICRGFSAELSELEKACYFREPFLTGTCLVPRTPGEQIKLLTQLVKKGKEISQAYLKMAQAYLSLGRYKEAADAMEYYVQVEKRSPESLRKLADFYGERLDFDRQIKVLEELANRCPVIATQTEKLQAEENRTEEYEWKENCYLLQEPEAVTVYREIIRIARRYNLVSCLDRTYQKLIDLFPKNPGYRQEYIQELISQKRFTEALQQLTLLGKLFPHTMNSVCRRKSEIYLERKQPDKAVACYEEILSSCLEESLYFDYFNLLRRWNQFSTWKKKILKKKDVDLETMAAQFYLYKYTGQMQKAETFLQEWVKVKAERLRKPELFRRLAMFLISAGHLREAAAALYSCWMLEPAEKNLVDLFSLVENATRNLPFNKDRLSTCFNGKNFDRSPGFLPGVLSLLLNDTRLWPKLKQLEEVCTIYGNFALAYQLFLEFRKQFPTSQFLPQLQLKVIEIAFRYGAYNQVIAWGENYLSSFPDQEGSLRVLETIAESYYARNNFPATWETYTRLLKMTAESDLRKFYPVYLEKYIRKLIAQKEYLRVIEIYWAQIREHPREEKLYQHFLSFISSHNLYQEELNLYQEAVKRFPSSSWYHRLARWYLKRKGKAAFQEITRKIREVLNAPELESYIQNFSSSWDGEDFTLEMARYAHDRFPTSRFFARYLFDQLFFRYNWGRRPAYEKMMVDVAVECFWLDEHIRKTFYRYLFWKNLLTEESRKAASVTGRSYLLFRAEAESWFSRYEIAYPLFSQLSIMYPDSKEILSRTADLARSLGQTQESCRLYLSLAERYPAEKDFWIKAGEVMAEVGEYQTAGRIWENILKIGPYESALHLELATLYWDYYQYEKAIAAIQKVRQLKNEPYLMARELALLYEGKKDYPLAVREYVLASIHQVQQRYRIISRLVYLAKSKNLGSVIDATFTKFLSDREPESVFAYGEYLERSDRTGEKKALYSSWLNRFPDQSTLERFYRYFEGQGETELVAAVLNKMVEVSGQSRHSLSRLAAFYESQGHQELAENVYQRMLARFREEEDYIFVLQEIKNYYLRRKDTEKAMEYLKQAIRISTGEQRESLSLELINRLLDLNRFSEVRQLLGILLRENPLQLSFVEALATVYQREKDWKGLEEFQKETIRQIQKSQLSSEEKQERIISFRRRLIDIYIEAKLFREALDQYLEILNRKPENQEIFNQVYTFCHQHDLLPVVKNYYYKTAVSSFRDYRWAKLLAEIALREGELEEARNWYWKALQQEPQRSSLWESLAQICWQLGDWKGAGQAWEKLWRLQRSPQPLLHWLKLSLRQGNSEESRVIVKQLLSGKNIPASRYLQVAGILCQENQLLESWSCLVRCLELVSQDPYENVLQQQDREILGEVSVLADREIDFLERAKNLLAVFSREKLKEKNFEQEKISQNEQVLCQSVEKMASFVEEKGTVRQKERLDLWVRKHLKEKETVSSDLLLTIARNSHLPEAEKEILLFRINHASQQGRREKVEELLQYYLQRQDFHSACQLLASERDRYTDWQRNEYQRRLARLCLYLSTDGLRLQPDIERELTELFLMLQLGKGDIAENTFPSKMDSPEIQRFLELTWRYRDRCRILVSQPHRYTPDLLQFLLEKGEEERSFQTIDGACGGFRPVWKNTKKILLSWFFQKPFSERQPFFTSVLKLAPVFKQLHQPVNRQDELFGSDWFVFARRYGQDLLLAGSNSAGDYLVAELEGSPLSGSKQVELADWYCQQKKYEQALKHYSLAGQLDYNSTELLVKVGSCYLAMGEKEAAVREWKKIIVRFPPKVEEVKRCLRVLRENGFEEEAWNVLEETIWEKGMIENAVASKEILTSFANLVNREDKRWTALLKKVVASWPHDIGYLEKIINSGWVPIPEQEFFYHQVLKVLSGNQHLPSFRYQLDRWQERLADYYLNNGFYQQAVYFLQGLQKSGKENHAASWTKEKLLQALIFSGRWEQALSLEESYLLDNPEAAVSVAGWWARVKQWSHRRRVLKNFYRQYLDNPQERKISALIGLASIFFEENNEEQATRILQIMVQQPGEEENACQLAAETAQRYGRTELALDFRQKLATLDAGNLENRLEIARLLAARGENSSASDTLLKILSEEKGEKKVKLQAAELLGRLAVTLPESKQQELLTVWQTHEKNLYYCLAYACYLFRSGKLEKCFQYLETKGKDFSWCYDLFYLRARLAEESGRINLAVGDWLKVLFYSPENIEARFRLFHLFIRRGTEHKSEHQYYQALQVVEAFLPPGISSYWQSASSGEEPVSQQYLNLLESISLPVKDKVEFLEALSDVMVSLGRLEKACEVENYIQRIGTSDAVKESRKRQQRYRMMADLERRRKQKVLKLTGDLANKGSW